MLVPCRECNAEFSSESAACPNCGAKALKRIGVIAATKRPSFITLLTIFFFPAALIWLWVSPIYLKDGEYARPITYVTKLRYSLVILSIWGVVVFTASLLQPATTYALPKCDDDLASSTLKEAVENSPIGSLTNVKIFQVEDASQLSWSEEEQVRRCRVKAYTNAGEQDISFSMKWIDRASGKWWLQTLASASLDDSG